MSEKKKDSISFLANTEFAVPHRPSKPKRTRAFVIGLCLGALAAGGIALRTIAPTPSFPNPFAEVATARLCPQAKVVTPTKHSEIWESLIEKSATDEYQARVVGWLSGAVRIPTESHDHMGPVGEDPRWEVFGPFHDYLQDAFPLVHSTLSLTKVNTWGLVYAWSGSDDSLKPILLTAHQDVVPVNEDTVGEWRHPPYSGYFDGEKIWGRGSIDDKGGLIGMLAAVENLISSGFEPTRGVVLAFGFDEEKNGPQGAKHIGDYLLSFFGRLNINVTSVAGFEKSLDSVVALPAVAEKGYIDVRLSVKSPGGHSSLPPKHTTIGLLAAFITEIEANPIPRKLSRSDVFYDTLVCSAAHTTGIDKGLRRAILASIASDEALKAVESMILNVPLISGLIGTTRAVDIINGGVKSNALPEEASAIINHRIAIESSVSEVMKIDTELVQPIAEKFNLSLTAFGNVISDPSVPYYGSIVLSDAWGSRLEPAPISPYRDSVAYNILSGTIKNVYNAHRGLEGNDNIKIYPSYMTGNTDTKYYWKLSENIYRYNHLNGIETNILRTIHTVNERQPLDGFLEIIEFFTALILNADEEADL